MADLMTKNAREIKPLRRGDVVEGTITEKGRRSLYIDIGAKTEGIVLDRDLADAKELISELEVGDTIRAIVAQAENDSGQIVLSLKRAAMDRAWGFFEEKVETNESFGVIGSELNKGGL
ncbi:S1 RNA-binding domain-containing protein, partial [Patescibacteria group bacterium]|nr:S1 RNA-binding domain-containing protein [Patescibacteria group bacterium]